jgi:hypothetical protein
MKTRQKKGSFTIRTAGVFFLLSAAFQLFAMIVALLLGETWKSSFYDLLYVALFGVIGIGLWDAKPWGDKAVYVGTAVSTVLGLLDHHTALTELRAYGVDTLALDPALLVWAITLVPIACWWGLALYIYMRRDYFRAVPPPLSTDD